MSNTPEPCTKLSRASRAPYVSLRKHLSLVLAGERGELGRAGLTICGLAGAVDQERANQIAAIQKTRNIKIHELAPCQRCHRFL